MKITVTKDNVKIEKFDIVHEGEHKVNKCSFSFSEEYTEDLVKKAIFTLQNDSIEVPIINNECDIPTEILKAMNIVLLGVYAYKVTGDKLDLRFSPSPDAFKVNSGSYIEGASESEEIMPSQFEKYMQALNDGLNKVEESLNKMDSATSSAMQLVDEIEQKLENGDFIGPEGPQGPQGVPGTNGKDGVGITTITSGQSTVEDDKTVTPVIVEKSDGSSQSFKVEAKNGIDGQNGKDGQDGVNGQDGLTPTIGDNGNWYLGDTDTGKPSRGEVGPSPDLTDYVKNTDYANTTKAGVFKPTRNLYVNPETGYVYAQPVSKEEYNSSEDTIFISKGTLENIKDDYVGSSTPVQDLNNNLDNLTPKNTASGEVVSVDDAIAYKTFNVTVDGASEQENTTGKQLFNKADYSFLDTSLNETGLGLEAPETYKTVYISCKNNTTYTISKEKDITKNRLGLAYSDSVPTYNMVTKGNIINNDAEYLTITTDNTASYLIAYVWITGQTLSFEEVLNTLQIEEGSAATSYEPYTGGQPSPNPDYPQEITTLTFDKITRCGKNLFDYNDVNAVADEIEVGDNGWITVKFDNTEGSTIKFVNYFTNKINLKPNHKYNVFLEVKEVEGDAFIVPVSLYRPLNIDEYNKNEGQFITRFTLNFKDIKNGNIYNKIITTDNTFKDLKISLRTFIQYDPGTKGAITFRLSLLEDTSVTPQTFVYEPYQGQTYDIDLQGNEMVELPDGVKDELQIDKGGNVNLIKKIGKILLNDVEKWNLILDTDTYWEYANYNLSDSAKYSYCLSNHFSSTEDNRLIYKLTEIYCRFPKSLGIDVSDTEKFKQWLSSNNVYGYYEKTTPQTIPLGKLTDIITTLNGTNNISINGNIPTTISTTYALDIKKYIDNKLAEISTAMIEEG